MRLQRFDFQDRPSFRWRADSLQLPPGTVFTRSNNTATYFDLNGTLQNATANVPRFNFTSGVLDGYLVEGSATNQVLWSRDLTNAAWVKTTATAALDQTGLDVASNTASSLLATAGNAMVLQTITLTSVQRTLSFYLKRITGSGTVNITQDGTTWTAVGTLSSSAWTRVSLTATQLNPVVGIQIVTNGDKIAVDGAQLEALDIPSSVIPTTTATVTRSADSAGFTVTPWVNPSAGTVVVFFTPYWTASLSTLRSIFCITDGSTSNRVSIVLTAASSLPTGRVTTGGSALLSAAVVSPSVVAGVQSIAAIGWNSAALPYVASDKGALKLGGTIGAPVGITTGYLGLTDLGGTGSPPYAALREVLIYPFAMTPNQVAAAIQPR